MKKPFLAIAAAALALAALPWAACDDNVTLNQAKKPEIETVAAKPQAAAPEVKESKVLEPKSRADFFKQRNAVVDILWVIDNSTSMADDQKALAANFSSFIGFLSATNVDYHIGVVDSDMQHAGHQGRLQGTEKVITTTTADKANAFPCAI